ncbi:MAG: hypothetical protein HUK22_07845, partial [Thermoguttaceae bacterium]|nr:hypothetical protein [Thermoguttaceae bacterium]
LRLESLESRELLAATALVAEAAQAALVAAIDEIDADTILFADGLAADSNADADADSPSLLTPIESVSLTISTPKVGEGVAAKVTPKDATCDYQWYRVDSEGTATAISGATRMSYTVTLSDVNYSLRVVVTGKGDYQGEWTVQTESIAPAMEAYVNKATIGAFVTAVNGVAEGGTIRFADTLAGSTIAMGGSEIVLNKSVTIDAGDLNITIDARNRSRIFSVNSGCEVALNGLTLSRGSASGEDNGGAIYNAGALTVTNTMFTGNSANSGGAIDNVGSLTVTNTTFTGNSAKNGGAIDNVGSLTVTNTTFTGNSANSGGAIYNAEDYTVTLANSIATGNSGQDIYGAGSVYSYYSIVGDESLTFAQNVGSQLNVAPQDVFKYDEAGKIILENGV